MDDQELIRSYQSSGDMEILGTLFEKHLHLVYGVSLKYLKDRDDAQDAVMQVFEKLLKELKHTEVKHFQSWLYVVTRNYCLMQLRKRKTSPEIAGADENSDPWIMEKPEHLHLNHEDIIEKHRKGLEKCLESLNDQQRSCVKLFYLEEKCYREIAEITKFELKKVKSYIQNGKRNLKNCLEGNHGK